jgi:hypothetical protein
MSIINKHTQLCGYNNNKMGELMKGLLFTAFIISNLMTINYSYAAARGNSSGGGGDALELRINEIRSDLLNWVNDGGSKELHLPSTISQEEYVSQMTDILQPKKVIIGLVEKDDETNDELKVTVDGEPKTCRGFISKIDSMPHILCNIQRFKNTGESLQYKLIHHEFAGLVGLEQNTGAASDYQLSEQITDFLVVEKVLKLSVKRSAPGQLNSSYNALREFRVNTFDYSVKDGYAIAWGIKGELLDFEKLENASDEEISKIISNPNLANYVVDLRRNKILSVYDDGEMVEIDIDHRYGNHYQLMLYNSFIVENLPNNLKVSPTVVSGIKWWSAISEVLLIDEDKKDNVTPADLSDFDNILDAQIKPKLTKKNLEIYEDGAGQIESIETVTFKNKVYNEIKYTYDIPKTDIYFTLRAIVEVRYENGKLIPKLISMTQKKD